MTDQVEQPASADSAVQATEQTAQTVETPQTTTQEDGLLAALETLQPTADDDIEEELEGIKLKGKKDALERIKSERLMHADYTRKTQEVADQRRDIETRAQALQQVETLHQQVIEEIADVRGIDKRTNQLRQALSQVNYATLSPEQQPQIMAAQTELAQLQALRVQLAGSITHKQQQMQVAKQQETATQTTKAEAYLRREIKDWSREKDLALEQYAQSEGINTPRLKQFLLQDPAIVRVLDKAAKFDQLMKQQLAKRPTAPPATPIARVTPKDSPAIKDPDKMSVDEWRVHREAEIAARRKKR